MKKIVALLCLSVAVGALMGKGSPQLQRKTSSQDLRSSAETRAAEQTANRAVLAARRPASPSCVSPCGSLYSLRRSAEHSSSHKSVPMTYSAEFPGAGYLIGDDSANFG